jgi:uncharacterized protein YggU (UPF0235/DUF167 family)
VTGNRASLATATSNGITLRVRLTPKSSSDRIDGLAETAEGHAVFARVRAVPADGEANAALVRLVADWLDVPKSSVSLAAGHKSRVKTIALAGHAPELLARLAARTATWETKNEQ